MRDPEREDFTLILRTLQRRLAEAETGSDFAPGEYAALRRLADEMEECLRPDEAAIAAG